jgi:hypothetical protein
MLAALGASAIGGCGGNVSKTGDVSDDAGTAPDVPSSTADGSQPAALCSAGPTQRAAPACVQTGCSAQLVLDGLSGTTVALTADGSQLYLADSATGVVTRRPLASPGEATVIATGFQGAVAMAMDCQWLYVSMGGLMQGGCTGDTRGRVVAISRFDGTQRTLWDQTPSCPAGIAVTTDMLYIADFNGAPISRVPLGGAGAATTLDAPLNTWGIAASGCSLYYTVNDGDNSVWQEDLCAGTAATRLWSSIALTGVDAHPDSVLVDGQFVYWADAGSLTNAGTDGNIMIAHADGQWPGVLVAAPYAHSLVATDAGLLWIEQDQTRAPVARVRMVAR